MKKITLITIIAFFLYFTSFTVYAEDIGYTVINGRATITGLSGEPEILVIPSELGGAPVTEIRDNAFYKCSSLREITLPEGLKKMGHHCFYECTSLEKIVIPDSVSETGMGCFEGCSSLEEIILPENLTILPESCFRDCSSLKSIILPQGITDIQKFCFAGCSSLSGISFSGNLVSIGDLAFYGCNSADDLYIPDSVKYIGIHSLGYNEYGKLSGFSITGSSGSASEKYAEENGFYFSAIPETAEVFAPAESRYAPVKLPEILIFSGMFFFIMAIITTFRKKRRR